MYRLPNKKRLLQHLQILLDGILAYSDTFNRFERILYLRRVCQSPEAAINQFFHYITASDVGSVPGYLAGMSSRTNLSNMLLFPLHQTLANHWQPPYVIYWSRASSKPFRMCTNKLTHWQRCNMISWPRPRNSVIIFRQKPWITSSHIHLHSVYLGMSSTHLSNSGTNCTSSNIT